ncbi:MAG: DUF4345 family protein [Flavobacteriaceae bacterium]
MNVFIARSVNVIAGALLLVLGGVGYVSPEWFFTEKYDVLTPTPQSKTILRVMMGFMTTMGLLWLVASLWHKNQRPLLAATIIMTLGFISSRVGGLFLYGFDQIHTYHELGFEIIALNICLWVYSKYKKTV